MATWISLPNTALAKEQPVDVVEQEYLFNLGQHFALAVSKDNLVEARSDFKTAVKSIYKAQTPTEKLEAWLSDKNRFTTMLAEAFTVAVAIAAAEMFLHPANGGINTQDVSSTILTSVGIVVGTYMPYRLVADTLKKRQNRKLLAAFMAGANSVLELPEDPTELYKWLLKSLGPSKSLTRCQALLM